MSYIKIKIGGKERGLKFNQFAAQEFGLNYTKHSKLATDNPELFFLYNLFYSGLAGNCKAKGEEIDFTFFDVVGWIDDMYEQRQDEQIQSVVTVFKDSRLWEDIIKTTEATDKKKEVAKSQPKKKLKNTGATA